MVQDSSEKEYQISIGFKVDWEYKNMLLNQNAEEYLRSTHLFDYKSDSTMRVLLKEILSHTEIKPHPDFTDIDLWGKFYGIIDGEDYELNFDYLIKDYADNNMIDGIVWLHYLFGSRGGYGGAITTSIRLKMPSSEHGHERIPHVHIIKGKYRKDDPHSNVIRINLNDLSIMDNAGKKFKHLFNKKEQELIIGILFECKEKLIKNYYAMLKGACPEVIIVDFEGHSYQFGASILNPE